MTWAKISLALLVLGCSGTSGEECAHGEYIIEAKQLDGKCGGMNARKTFLSCETETVIGSSEYVAENGETRLLTWEDHYDLATLTGDSTMQKLLPEKQSMGAPAWGTTEAMVQADAQPAQFCESHYALALTKQ